MRRYLVVASQTLLSSHLKDEIVRLIGDEPCELYFLVPATPIREHLVWTEGKAASVAHQRLGEAVARFRHMAVAVDGRVGDANPVLAVQDVLRGDRQFDMVIVSTLPRTVPRWLGQDQPRRIERATGLPVRAVVAPAEAPATA